MHELSICEAMLGQLKHYLAGHPASRITAVQVEVGRLSGVDPEALKFAWTPAQESAGLTGIRLEIDRRPVMLRCDECGRESEVVDFAMKCGCCESEKVKISGGRELKIKSFEIEEDEHV